MPNWKKLIVSGSDASLNSLNINTDLTGSNALINNLDVSGSINLEDGVKLNIGTGNDLQIFHDGTTSNISNIVGNLSIINHTDDGDIKFFSDDGSGGVAEYFRLDGGQTQTIFSQNAQFQDSARIKLGSGGDLQLYHTGTTSLIENYTGDLVVKNLTHAGDIKFQAESTSGNLHTYFTVDGGITKTTFSRDTKHQDTIKGLFGTNDDLQLYHDGSNSYISQQGTGDLILRQNVDNGRIRFQGDDGSGGISTYFDLQGSQANGTKVFTNWYDNSVITLGNGLDVQIWHDGSNSFFYNQGGDLTFQQAADDRDIIFSSDDGSGGVTPYMVVDGSAEQTRFYKNTRHTDGVLANFGNSDDLQIYHDGSNSYVKDTGAGSLILVGTDLQLKSAGDEFFMYGAADGQVALYNNGIKKFETTSTGASILGRLDLPGTNTFFIESNNTAATFNLGSSIRGYNFINSNGTLLSLNSAGNAVFKGDITITDTSGQRGISRNNTGYNLQLMGGTDNSDGAFISLSGETRGGAANSYNGRIEIYSGGGGLANQAAALGDIIFGTKWNGGSSNILVLDSSTNNATFAGNVTAGSNTITAAQFYVQGTYPRIYLADTDSNDDYSIINNNGTFLVYNDTDSSIAFAIGGDNSASFTGDVTVNGGDIYLKYSSTTQRAISSTGTNSLQVGDASVQMLRFKNAAGNALDIAANGNANFAGDVTVAGTLTAQEFHTEFVSASIIYQSGSTKFGDTSDDNHDFTGSLNVLNGNLTVEGAGVRQINLESSNSEVRLGLKGNNGNQFRLTSDGTYFRLKDATKERIKITNAGDTTFGGRDSGGNQLTWMTLKDQTGNVGIGTTSPQALLNIESTTAPTLRISNGGGTSPSPKLEFFRQAGVSSYIQYDVANKILITDNDHASGVINYKINGSEKMRIKSSGQIQFNEYGSGTFTGTVQSTLGVDSSGNIIEFTGGGGGSVSAITSGADTRVAYFNGTDSLEGSANFTWDDSTLDVNGNIKLGDSNKLILGAGSDLNVFHDGANSYFENKVGDLIFRQEADDKDIIFKSDNGSGGDTEYFRLDGGEGITVASRDMRMIDNKGFVMGTDGDSFIKHTGGQFSFFNDTGHALFYNRANDKNFQFHTDDGSGGTTAYFTLDGSNTHAYFSNPGNVGIGTTNPTRGNLVVEGDFKTNLSGNGQLAVIGGVSGSNASGSGNGGQMVFGGSISTSDSNRTFGSVGGYKENDTSGNRAGYLSFGTRQAASPDDIFERMRITSTGNVGIGTTSPNDILVVSNGSGEVRFGGGNGRTLSAYANGNLSNFDFYANQTYFNSDFLIAPGKKISTSNGSNNNLYLTTTDTSKAIYTDRNVGIGTTSPDFKLDVDGTFGVSGIPLNTDSTFALVADEILGSQLIPNGNFATNSNWNLGQGQWTITGGAAVASNAGNILHTGAEVASSNGIVHKVIFTLSDVTGGYVKVGLSNLETTQYNTNGTYTVYLESSGNNYLYFQPYGFTGKVSNVSTYEVTNNQVQKRELGTGAFGPTPVGAYLPLTGGTMTGVTQFNDHTIYGDQVYAKWGAGNDLTIGHNATNSVISNAVGNLYISNHSDDKDIIFECDNGSGASVSYLTLDGSTTHTYFSNPGNVGIGTSDPTSKLQVYGNSTYISSKNTSNHKVVEIGADSSGDGLIVLRDSSNNNKVKLYAENNADNYINNGGKVGIGTSSPGYKLDVNGDIQNNGVLRRGGNVYIKSTGSDTAIGPAGAGTITFHTSSVLTGAAEAMRIDADGNLLLNNTSAGARLDIREDTNYAIRAEDASGHYFRVNTGGDVDMRGDLVVQGTITAQQFHSEFVSASIIYDSGSTKFGDTQDDNHDFTGSLNVSGSVHLSDNSTLKLGNVSGGDLQLYHNGSHSLITNQTGNLYIRNQTNDGKVYFQADDGNGNDTNYFYLDGTRSDGTNFATRFPDQSIILLGSGTGWNDGSQIYHNGSNFYLNEYVGDMNFTVHTNNGDIKFNSDDGSGGVTEYFRIDGNAELNIFYKDVFHGDNKQSLYGNNSDLKIFHNGSNSHIQNATGDLYVENLADDKDVIFRSDDGSGGFAEYFRLDGGSTMNVFSKPTWHGDGVKSFFGNSQDLEIYHDGSNSYIKDSGTGDLIIYAANFRLGDTNGESWMRAYQNAAVELYYNNSKKFETTNTGVAVTGDIDADDITIDDWGSVSASLSAIQTAGGVNGAGSANRIALWSDSDTLTSDGGLTYSSDTLFLEDADYTSMRINSDVKEHSSIEFMSSSVNLGRIGWHEQGYFASSAMSVNPSPAMFINAPNGFDFAVNNTGSLSIKSGSADVIIDSKVNLGIGTASPTYKLSVNGGISAGGKVTYTKSAGSLDTTGYAVAGLTAASNGASAGFTFTCYGHGGYQKVVYSCYNVSGTWNTVKAIDEGTNALDIEASANGSTITFTFKTRSGTKYYTPRVTIEATGTSINNTYA